MTAPPAELVDIVDEHDRVVDVATRAAMRRERLMHRAVFIAVRHPDGRLLVHRRSLEKDLWPGRWDLAVGGVVSSGEEYDDAARRELAEEVGIANAVPEAIGGGVYRDADVALVGRCYQVVAPGPFEFADGEVIEAEWVSLHDLPALMTSRLFLPDSVELLLPLLG